MASSTVAVLAHLRWIQEVVASVSESMRTDGYKRQVKTNQVEIFKSQKHVMASFHIGSDVCSFVLFYRMNIFNREWYVIMQLGSRFCRLQDRQCSLLIKGQLDSGETVFILY